MKASQATLKPYLMINHHWYTDSLRHKMSAKAQWKLEKIHVLKKW